MNLNLNDQFKKVVAPKMFNSANGKPNSEVFSFVYKLNIFLSHIPVQDSVNLDYLAGMTSFAVTNYSQILLDNAQVLTKLSRNELTSLISIPIFYLEQLLSDTTKSQLG